ncbi:MAG: carbohydrate kinase family protein [Patescibacteria group bacterium]|nr:carbohydrate kinase family protein [Patescibacteria group bacterium]MDD5295256.1 carbohydrate kinase family protein [Patescibacteria group bacterium]MDD5554503.1 carbohydrate kinase family protein [Patescibacteria group bacterium]
MNKIVVSGSLVYDRIMDFPGEFKDHILPDKIHILNVSFTINKLRESFGGTAGNIAYNLSLLGEKPIILGMAGTDFFKYEKWLKNRKIDISKIGKSKKELTASAYIITDRADNQITGFYPGPRDKKYCRVAKKIKNVKIAIVSPEAKERMLGYVKVYKKLNIPYVFDPGQQITSFSRKELERAVAGSKVLIGNDYEIQLIVNRLRLNLGKLRGMTEMLVITKGAQGSEIYHEGKTIKIPAAKPKNTSDPTGAGDAYRAGLIRGLMEGWPLEKTGRLAALVAVYTVEKYGTQTHYFSWKGLKKRYRENFGKNF